MASQGESSKRMSSSNMITMMGSDGEKVVVEESAAVKSQMLKLMLEESYSGDIITIPNVTGAVLSSVFDYVRKHVDDVATHDDEDFDFLPKDNPHKDFDDKFLDVDTDTLYDLLMASNYLEVKELLKLICKKVAGMIKGKSPEEIRQIFKIKNDLTPEEEEDIRKKNPWAFEQR